MYNYIIVKIQKFPQCYVRRFVACDCEVSTFEFTPRHFVTVWQRKKPLVWAIKFLLAVSSLRQPLHLISQSAQSQVPLNNYIYLGSSKRPPFKSFLHRKDTLIFLMSLQCKDQNRPDLPFVQYTSSRYVKCT